MNISDIKKQAETELLAEQFREAVEREKERLRTHRTFWERVFPWRIRIERRTPPKEKRP